VEAAAAEGVLVVVALEAVPSDFPPSTAIDIGNYFARRASGHTVTSIYSASSSDVIRFTPAFSIAVQAAASELLVSMPRQASSIT
jgi:hypothetical protein